MDWQQITALGIVGVTAGLFLWNKLRKRPFQLQKDTHCGCASQGEPRSGSIVFKARKGQRREIVDRSG